MTTDAGVCKPRTSYKGTSRSAGARCRRLDKAAGDHEDTDEDEIKRSAELIDDLLGLPKRATGFSLGGGGGAGRGGKERCVLTVLRCVLTVLRCVLTLLRCAAGGRAEPGARRGSARAWTPTPPSTAR
jgi:hypothetical protein